MDLLFKTKKLITERNLIDAGDHVLIAVSGGIDSMMLAHVLIELKDEIGFLLSIAHVNHGLRGADSDGDEQFVKDFCKTHDISFRAVRWKGPEKGENLQDAARKFRYENFYNVAEHIGSDRIALAHNLEDQAETVLLNIIRGAGLDGLCGMNLKTISARRQILIRPFLTTGREEIEAYSRKQKIAYRKDATNDQTKYTRNFLRHKVMPILREINPAADSSIAGVASRLQIDNDYIQTWTLEAFQQLKAQSSACGMKLELDGAKFCDLDPAIRRRILIMAYEKAASTRAGIAEDHILKMDEIATGSNKDGSYNLPNDFMFERKGTRLAFFKK